MKKIWILALCALCTWCCTNGQHEQEAAMPYQFSKSEADILCRHLKVENGLYVYTLSKEETLKKGVSAAAYQEMENCLTIVNESLKEAIQNGVPISYFDPQDLYKGENKE